MLPLMALEGSEDQLSECWESNPEINIVAVNDLVDPHMIAYLLKYDSISRPFKGEVRYDENHLIVNGKKNQCHG